MRKYLFSLFAIIFVSACVDLPGFGQGNVQTTELPPDIIIVQNMNTIPNPPVNAKDQFTVSFEVKNQDDINEITNVGIQLFDYCLCSPQISAFTPTDWPESGGVYSKDLGSFAPGQTEFIEWTF